MTHIFEVIKRKGGVAIVSFTLSSLHEFYVFASLLIKSGYSLLKIGFKAVFRIS